MAQDMLEGNIGQGKKRCPGNSHGDVNVHCDISQFSGDKATSDGLNTYCKLCIAQRNKKYSPKKRANKNAAPSELEIKFNVNPSKQDLTLFFNIK